MDEHLQKSQYLENNGLSSELARPVTSLSGISQARMKQLARLDIYTVWDLLRFFPRAYEDWQSNLTETGEAMADGSEQVIVGKLCQSLRVQYKGRLSYIRSQIADAGGKIAVVWFNQPWLQNKLNLQETYVFRGKVKLNGNSLCLQSPKIQPYQGTVPQTAAASEVPDRGDSGESAVDLQETADAIKEPLRPVCTQTSETLKADVTNRPLYSLTSGLAQITMQKLLERVLQEKINYLPECLPLNLCRRYKLADSHFAYRQIHFPSSPENLLRAKKRLAFTELLLLQLALHTLGKKSEAKAAQQVELQAADLKKIQEFIAHLPFTLTAGQNKAWQTVIKDLAQAQGVSRLLQGDTGSGKTIVAVIAMFACRLQGKQAVLMAPTQILATQHYATVKQLLAGYVAEDEIALATGNLTAKQKRELAAGINSGAVKIVIGTHALLNENYIWQDMALAVTDEQHRFGVNQRLRFLQSKDKVPHLLVMSATPIPRSLALVLYGDLQVSCITERPAERLKVLTYMANYSKLGKIYDYLRAMIAQENQVYWICPLVEAQEESGDLMAAVNRQAELQRLFPHLTIGLVHGKMKEKDKAQVMQDFYQGKIQVLVATTVVEVGVDNPAANLIVIENAERFGLAQLHQLRGRVGRGDKQAICILLSEQATTAAKNANTTAYQRLLTLCESDDGFYLANKDLELRGPGDFFGVRQHGLPEFKVANLYQDKELIAATQAAALEILQQDPALSLPENQCLKRAIAWYYPDLQGNIVL